MKLFKDFNPVFKKIRSTDTGSRIIDVENPEMYQTPWLKVVFKPEFDICVDSTPISDKLIETDNFIVNYLKDILDFDYEDILYMYKHLERGNLFKINITTNTVLFDKEKNEYIGKKEISEKLEPGNFIRLIIKPKKIYFKNHVISFQLELVQAELA